MTVIRKIVLEHDQTFKNEFKQPPQGGGLAQVILNWYAHSVTVKVKPVPLVIVSYIIK